MKKDNDAFGVQLMAMQNELARMEIVERDDGYVEAVDTRAWYFSSPKDWSGRERKAMKEVKGRVLDIGCGAGRTALYLQSRGLDVTGMDISPLAVKVSAMRGVKKVICRSIDDIGTFRSGSFDSIVMMGNNFGLFGGALKARRLLAKMFKITSPEGRIYAETLDPYAGNNPDHTSYHAFNRRRGRMGGQVRIRIRYHKLKGAWFDYLFVSREELLALLKGTGWKLEKTFSSGGPQYIAVLAKERLVRNGRK